jgi:hypothetical protein
VRCLQHVGSIPTPSPKFNLLPARSMVGPMILDHRIEVRFLGGQPTLIRRRLMVGHNTLDIAIPVRLGATEPVMRV